MPHRRDLQPPELEFLRRHIRSVDDLALLMAIVDAPDRWWDATSAAQVLGTGPVAATRVLEHLARHNLLDIRVTADVRYQFRPLSDALREEVLALAAAYRANPLSVLRAVEDIRRRNIRDFADAFRFRRDDDER